MGFATEPPLQSASPAGDRLEPPRISQEQLRPLVGREAPGKTQREHPRIEPDPRAFADERDERLLGRQVRGPPFVRPDAQRVAQAEISLTLAALVVGARRF